VPQPPQPLSFSSIDSGPAARAGDIPRLVLAKYPAPRAGDIPRPELAISRASGRRYPAPRAGDIPVLLLTWSLDCTRPSYQALANQPLPIVLSTLAQPAREAKSLWSW